MKFKRVFLIVMDSVGIGEMPDAARFNDVGANTWVHVADANRGLNIPILNSLGLGVLAEIQGTTKIHHPHSFVQTLKEKSNGKDTLTGHWEMMGILTPNPLVTFTDTGFPKELIDLLSERTGHKIIGNYAASGTEILKVLGPQAIAEKALIVYTSADSVLQIAAHVGTIPLEELYRCCEIAREITLKDEWRVGRVIARPFLGDSPDNFYRTSDRRDYALSPSGRTALNDLLDNNYSTIAIGKIHDIFNGVGIKDSIHTVSNDDGMNKTIEIARDNDFTGLCFVNLVEFDSLYGHRRNPIGYGKAIEAFDRKLATLLPLLHDDDLLLITADHGNDPTFHGTDHTRERVPLISYSSCYVNGQLLPERESFADIGKTILANFNITPSKNEIGETIVELLNN